MTRNFSLAIAQAVKILRKNQLAQLIVVIVVAVAATALLVLLSERECKRPPIPDIRRCDMVVHRDDFNGRVRRQGADYDRRKNCRFDNDHQRANFNFTIYRDGIIRFRREKN